MSPSRFGSGRRVQVNQSGGRYRAENSSRTSVPYSLVSLHPPPKPSTSRARRVEALQGDDDDRRVDPSKGR